MSVTYLKGDLLDWAAEGSTWNIVLHCCNAQKAFNSGVAKAIRDRYPTAFEAYLAGDMIPGQFSVAEVEPGRRVCNLIGQRGFGYDGQRYLDYEAFYSGLEIVRDLLEIAHKEGRVYQLAMPRLIGCVRAGGAPTIVDSMIQHLWAGSPVNVFLVELPNNTDKVGTNLNTHA